MIEWKMKTSTKKRQNDEEKSIKKWKEMRSF